MPESQPTPCPSSWCSLEPGGHFYQWVVGSLHIWILSRLCELLNLHVPQVLDSPEPRTVPAAPQSQTHPQRPPQVQPVSNTHPLAQHAPHRNSPPCTGPGQSWHPSPTHGAHLEGRAGPVPGLTAHLHPPDCHMSTRSSPPPPPQSHEATAGLLPRGTLGSEYGTNRGTQGHAGTCRGTKGFSGSPPRIPGQSLKCGPGPSKMVWRPCLGDFIS